MLKRQLWVTYNQEKTQIPSPSSLLQAGARKTPAAGLERRLLAALCSSRAPSPTGCAGRRAGLKVKAVPVVRARRRFREGCHLLDNCKTTAAAWEMLLRQPRDGSSSLALGEGHSLKVFVICSCPPQADPRLYLGQTGIRCGNELIFCLVFRAFQRWLPLWGCTSGEFYLNHLPPGCLRSHTGGRDLGHPLWGLFAHPCCTQVISGAPFTFP